MGCRRNVNKNNFTHGVTSYKQITTTSNHQNADNTISHDCNSCISCNSFITSNSLKIVSYNVDGLFSKLSDVDFLSFIDQFDCICLLETYMIDNIIPKNIFRQFLPAFFFPAIPSAGTGRASGGIIVLVKLKFKNIVSRIENNFHSSIVLLFKNVLSGLKKDLILVSSYILKDQPFITIKIKKKWDYFV